MTTFPVTKQQLIATGERFNSVDVLRQLDELLPLAHAYVSVLTGYDQYMLDDLLVRREALLVQVAARRSHRTGEKQGKRKEEADLIRKAKWLHREAIVVVRNSIRTRVAPSGETPAQTEEIVTDLVVKLAAQQGAIGNDAALVQTRLEGAIGLFALPTITDRLAKLSKGRDFPAELRAMIDRVTTTTQGKTGAQQKALVDTSDMDELDGRIYVNLKALVESGRAYFNRLGDTTRASLFNLNLLNGSSAGAAGGGGDVPAPGPAPAAN
jgi:hypothetical protein